MTSRGYYCIIHYCPNRISMECVMVGVILLSEEHHWMGASMIKDNRRAIRLFNMTERDQELLETCKDSLAFRVHITSDSDRNLSWLTAFALTWDNDLSVTPPRPLSVEDPEASMALLFDQLTRHERT